MMMNLFSIFDPSMYLLNLYPWLMILLIFVLMNSNKYFILNKINMVFKMVLSPLSKEIKPLLSLNMKKGNIMILLMLFLIIFMTNFLALFPFIFTPTAHMMITFPLAFVLWLSFMIFGWVNNTKNMMAHLVPVGTPLALMNFMVLIELVSNIIRPITLSVRLCANMVAGHLLLSLLSNFSLTSFSNMMFSFIGLIILGILEMAVALIQGYVFMTLLSLYSTEVHYELQIS